MASLTIVVDVRDNRTMSQYKMPASGKLTFENAGNAQLVVAPKSGSPLCKLNGTTVVNQLTVPVAEERTVRICNNFAGDEFLYTARIGSAQAEDPIVILERKFLTLPPKEEPIVILERESPSQDFLFAAVGFVLGLALAGLVLFSRSRSGGPR